MTIKLSNEITYIIFQNDNKMIRKFNAKINKKKHTN